MYLLDTNVCIQFLNKSSRELTWKLIGTDPDDIFLCSIVKAELFYGAHKSNNPLKALKVQKEFCNRFKSLPFDDSAAEVYGEIRSSLERKGQIIGVLSASVRDTFLLVC